MFLKLHPFYAILGLRPRWLKLYNYVHSLLLHTSLKGTQKAGIKVPRSMPPQHTTAMDGGSVDNVRNRFRPSTSMINAASDSSALASCFALTPTSVSSCPLAAYTPSCTFIASNSCPLAIYSTSCTFIASDSCPLAIYSTSCT